ncbi:MAG TPA: methyltransferase [Candidatus Nanopelagicaceae bacterium]|nr:methyltransferase [Candidatus Nanopelagicaceae bacterium]
MNAPRGDVDLEALADLAAPWCIPVAVTLRIADQIAAGVDRIEGLSTVTGSDLYALHGVLTYLVRRGVFLEPKPGRFALNAAAERLRDPSLFLDLDGIGGRMAGSWETLPVYVRTGSPGYQTKFGLPFWEDLATNPKLRSSFDSLMGPDGHGLPDVDIEPSQGWEAIRSVVDVGGGTGTFLAQLLLRHGNARGTLVDLPATVARSAATFEQAGVLDRVTIVGQSFFDALPAGADLYLLRHVLNDWPKRETVAILRRCAAALPAHGRVVVLGGVTADGYSPELTIEMVLLGGRTSSLTEFRFLASQAGLEVAASSLGPHGPLGIECAPRAA